MCLITLVPLNIAIPVTGIESGACSNPDGHGWAVASEAHGLVMGKSMNAEEAIAAFVAERARQGDNSVALFHSRLGTHGSKNLANVHPFYVPDAYGTDNGYNTVVAHNGIMPSLWHPDRNDDRSDTRVFADQTAAWYITERGVPSRRGGKALGEMIGRGNKLVFISTRMAGRPQVRIINADSGTWDQGVWFSNDWFKRKRPTTYRSTPTSGRACDQEGCKVTFYSATHQSKCSQHRVKVICGEKECGSEVLSEGETLCYQHRPKKICEEKTCHSVVAAKDTHCYRHKPSYVSPYAEKDSTMPQSWMGYGVFPDPEIDEETTTLLDDIEATLEDSVVVSDIDKDRLCDVCRTKGVVHIPTNLCLNCKWCLDCWVHMDHCTCFDYQKWLADRDQEAADLAAALAADVGEDAEMDRLAAERAEEEYLAQDPVLGELELTQEMREFYGITDEMLELARKAREATTVGEPPKAIEARKSTAPKKRGRAKPTTTGPLSTDPAAKSGR